MIDEVALGADDADRDLPGNIAAELNVGLDAGERVARLRFLSKRFGERGKPSEIVAVAAMITAIVTAAAAIAPVDR